MKRYSRYKIFIVGISILCAIFLSSCDNSPKPPDVDTIAVYKNGKVTRKDVSDEVDKLYRALGKNEETIRRLNNKKNYEKLVEGIVLDRMVKQKIIALKLDKRENIKHVMKHISEELNLSELHTRAHDKQIKVSDEEIKSRYEIDRPLYSQATLTQASEQIRSQIQKEKESRYFETYLEELQKNAVITRNDELLRVPPVNEAELRIHYDQNRTLYADQSYKQALNSIKETLQKAITEKWFRENRQRTLLTIHGKRLTVGQFYQEIEELPEMERNRYNDFTSLSALLDKMIERMLVVEDTYDQMLDSETKNERGHIRDDVLKQVLHQEEVDDQIKISEEEIKTFYDNNSNGFVTPPRIQINYLRINAGQTEQEKKNAEMRVREAYRKLKPGLMRFKKGEPFSKIATEYSEDKETAKNGGSLEGWISESAEIIEEIASHSFHENVLGLGEKDISRPFLFHGSYYIVQVRERQDPSPIPFDDARIAIEAELRARKHDKLSMQMEKTIIDQSELIIFDQAIESILKDNNMEG